MNKWVKKILRETTLTHQQALEAWEVLQERFAMHIGIPVSDFGEEEFSEVYQAMRQEFATDTKVDALLFARKAGAPIKKIISEFTKQKKCFMEDGLGPPASVIMLGPEPIVYRGGEKAASSKKKPGSGQTWSKYIRSRSSRKQTKSGKKRK